MKDPKTDKQIKCNGAIKPNISFIGEKFNKTFDWGIERMKNDENDPSCGVDLMIILGCPFKISPFNHVLDIDEGKDLRPCPKVLIG